jgi:polyisoprenoid-binding protein YceI
MRIFESKCRLNKVWLNLLPMLIRSCLTGIFFVLGFVTFAQEKYVIEKGAINFTSNAQLEQIKASSDKPQGLLDISTAQFAFTIDIKNFQGFNSQLQREHFNEKYLESEKFPKARFSGKIIESIDFAVDGTYDVRAKGDLEIHGVKQTRIIRTKLIVKKRQIEVESKFMVPLSDHNITIPNIVSQKIATEIEVDFRAIMKPR